MSNWKSIKLIDLCNVEYGTRVVRKRDAGTIFPVYGGGGATFSMDIHNRENRMVIARFAMSEKCTRFVNGKFFLNDSGLTISAKDKKLINEQFLNYQMLSLNDTIYSLARGTAQKNLNVDEFKNLSLSFPNSIQEQKEIVEILDQAFESIEKAKANIEKNIENAKELFQSKANQIFSQTGEGWREDKMVNLCDILTCGVASTPKYVDESIGIPFLSAQNVRNGKVILHKYRYISKEFHEHLTKKNKPTKGDILYSRVGAKFGEAAVVEHDFDFSVYVSLTLIRPNKEKLNNYYFKYYLNSPSIKSLAKSSITSSGVPNLNVKTVRGFPVFYPDLNKQKEIVETLNIMDNHIQSLLSSYDEELKNLEELKKSILQKAFEGELTNKSFAA